MISIFSYNTLLEMLFENIDKKYGEFSASLGMDEQKRLGVRYPKLKEISKNLLKSVEKQDLLLDQLFAFSNEYFEVTILKLFCLSFSNLCYNEKSKYFDRAVAVLCGWATCDAFASSLKKSIKDLDLHLNFLEKCINRKEEFYQRFALVSLLSSYVTPKYFQVIKDYIAKADGTRYYVHMGIAWLLAEVVVKYFESGKEMLVELVKKGDIDEKTFNKSIQKARESYRLTKEQKEQLLKLKNTKMN